jgi:hypothetical protein
MSELTPVLAALAVVDVDELPAAEQWEFLATLGARVVRGPPRGAHPPPQLIPPVRHLLGHARAATDRPDATAPPTLAPDGSSRSAPPLPNNSGMTGARRSAGPRGTSRDDGRDMSRPTARWPAPARVCLRLRRPDDLVERTRWLFFVCALVALALTDLGAVRGQGRGR